MSVENFESIKKGTKLLVNNGLGECNAYAMESIKQGKGFKKVLLVDMKASEIGFFDEIGSIYVSDILKVFWGVFETIRNHLIRGIPSLIKIPFMRCASTQNFHYFME